MAQPNWKLIANLGDVSPIDYGGYFVYVDTTGVYEAEVERLDSPDSDENGEWIVHRFSLDRCTFVDGILSDNKYHPEHAAWFASPERKGEKYVVCGDLASFIGQDPQTVIDWFCSENLLERAWAYMAVGDYHGYDNLDGYPLTFTNREEVEARYAEEMEHTS